MAQPKPASSGAAHTLPYNRLSPRQFEERRWVFQCKRVERFSPAPPDHFVGRERELSDLARALTDSDQPQAITALQGMGGIGKTALAKKLAADLDGQLPGGIFWADLPASEGDPLPILAAWGRACGHHLADLADPQARAAARGCLAAHLQAHGRAHRQPTAADYDALEAERTNLLAALDRADRAAQWPAVRRFVWALGAAGGYLWVRGYWGELRKRLAQAVRAAQAEGNKWETAAFVHNLAILAQDTGDLAEARRLYGDSLAIAEELGNRAGVASTLGQLANLADDEGDQAEAERLYRQALAIAQEIGDIVSASLQMFNLALLCEDQGRLAEALPLLEGAVEIAERVGTPRLEKHRRALERVRGKLAAAQT